MTRTTEALNLFVRRASAQSPIELVINKAGITEIVIVNIGQARNILRNLLPMVIGPGTTISETSNARSGKPLAGDAPAYRTRTVIIPASANGQARASR